MSFVEGRIIARRDWAERLMTLSVEAETQPFAPGQFLNLGLPVAGEAVFRPYSMASAPGAPLEFFLSEVDSGAFTPSLFQARVGDRVLVDPIPHGFFTLQWVPPAAELWMIATGTGLGPFISMLRSGEPLQRFERVVLAHGVRFASHLAYRDELAELAHVAAGRFSVVQLVSREAPPPGALSGRVTSAFADGRLERAAGVPITAERSHVMLCGNPEMIDEALALFATRGMNRHRTRKPGHITVEKYWD